MSTLGFIVISSLVFYSLKGGKFEAKSSNILTILPPTPYRSQVNSP